MYNDLKKHWDNQFRLSANKVFTAFQYNLERGGAQAQEFIEGNPNLIETVLGSPEEVEASLKAIAWDKEPAENQAYFFGVANGMLARVRALLARKYEASVRYCEQIGVPAEDFTPETLLPGVRKANEDGGFVSPEATLPATDPDTVTEVPGTNIPPEQKVPEALDDEVEVTILKEEVAQEAEVETTPDADVTPGTEANAAKTPADMAEDSTSITEDDLKAKINVLVGEGSSKQNVWQDVSSEAKAIGWNSKNAWAYIDEITPKQ